jgi:hypothetical protein
LPRVAGSAVRVGMVMIRGLAGTIPALPSYHAETGKCQAVG